MPFLELFSGEFSVGGEQCRGILEEEPLEVLVAQGDRIALAAYEPDRGLRIEAGQHEHKRSDQAGSVDAGLTPDENPLVSHPAVVGDAGDADQRRDGRLIEAPMTWSSSVPPMNRPGSSSAISKCGHVRDAGMRVSSPGTDGPLPIERLRSPGVNTSRD